jgi:hypothetical protein
MMTSVLEVESGTVSDYTSSCAGERRRVVSRFTGSRTFLMTRGNVLVVGCAKKMMIHHGG